MARIALIEKSISVAKKMIDPEKNSKGCFGPDDNTFDGDEAEGWKPKSNHRFDEQQETKSWHKSLIPTASR
jgi:hypothetical protein